MNDFEGICEKCGCSCCFILSKSEVFCPVCNKERKRKVKTDSECEQYGRNGYMQQN